MVPHEGGLPPLVIVAVQDVEDVTVFEGEARRGSVIIFSGVVVKESSVFVYECVLEEGGGMCIMHTLLPLLPNAPPSLSKGSPYQIYSTVI